MTVAAFLHGYPPFWSMGGEVSTHRTLRVVPGSVVFTHVEDAYHFDGVDVRPCSGTTYAAIAGDAESAGVSVLYAHSTMSRETVRAARRLRLPSVLAVHAPPRYAMDLRNAWASATVRLYNTDAARREWRDTKGWLLHPPIGDPGEMIDGPHDALTVTSSLLNKGADRVLALAERWPDRRFIIVRSPAHQTHGAPDFEEQAAKLSNVEVWDRLLPDDMPRLWAETRVLMVPSRYETYGMSAIEAAWHGVPSVHVDTPHVREGIGTAARLLRSHDLAELAAAVHEVDNDYLMWSARAHSRAHEISRRENAELALFAANVAALATQPRALRGR